ncbi:MAG TPA: phytanoyl-CoA dioxygenase family protein [Planctomycetota bacterium]|nr:phytanoyl-CoA dioxygenase family protein [Planctomycetota bacterium]
MLNLVRKAYYGARAAQQSMWEPRGGLKREQQKFWDDNGFLILPGHFSEERIDAVNRLVERLWTHGRTRDCRVVADIFIGTPQERRCKLKDAPLEARRYPFKINDLYLDYELVRELVLEDRLTRALEELIGGHVLACNTLNFEYGSQQDFHTDSLYMTPPKKLNLIATWIALETCAPEAGPLRYYPGSHMIPPYRFSTGRMTSVNAEMDQYRRYMMDEVQKRGLKEEIFCAKKGDVLIWHSQLFHGGAPIKDPTRTRKSLVTHYFKASDMLCQQGRTLSGGYYLIRDPQPVPAK